MNQNLFQFSDNHDNAKFNRKPDFFAKKAAPKKKKTTTKPTTEQSPNQNLPQTYSVTQLTRLIKFVLNDNLPQKITLEAEISNCTHHGSGHLYLTLKDPNAQVTAVMWKSAAAKLKFRPNDGMAVVATGRIDVYEPQGKYQFYIDKLEPAGLGALELAFRQLAEKLRNEGLFDPQHKKPIPKFPKTIAIVTSDTGAAVKDILNTLHRRFPIARKILYPVAVQGDNAAPQIAHAIQHLNQLNQSLGHIDLMIVSRGGGSIEDLWAFNEECVARAIHQSQIPIIAGVGHEIDTTIADMVADQRAATPTAAAELAVPVLDELLHDINQQHYRLNHAVRQHHDRNRSAFLTLAQRPLFTRPLDLVNFKQQNLDELTAQLNRLQTQKLANAARTLEQDHATLRRIEPHTALAQAQSKLHEQQVLLNTALKNHQLALNHRLKNAAVQLRAAAPTRQTSQHRATLTHLTDRLTRCSKQNLKNAQQNLLTCQKQLNNLNPKNVLQRGYSITRLQTTNAILTPDNPPNPNDTLITELAQNLTIESNVTKTQKTNSSMERKRHDQ